jgi:hypothetical protein
VLIVSFAVLGSIARFRTVRLRESLYLAPLWNWHLQKRLGCW